MNKENLADNLVRAVAQTPLVSLTNTTSYVANLMDENVHLGTSSKKPMTKKTRNLKAIAKRIISPSDIVNSHVKKSTKKLNLPTPSKSPAVIQMIHFTFEEFHLLLQKQDPTSTIIKHLCNGDVSLPKDEKVASLVLEIASRQINNPNDLYALVLVSLHVPVTLLFEDLVCLITTKTADFVRMFTDPKSRSIFCVTFSRLVDLVRKLIRLNERVAISLSYASLEALFECQDNALQTRGMELLIECFGSCRGNLRNLFLNEVLGGLAKSHESKSLFYFADQSTHMWTALSIQLVQSCLESSVVFATAQHILQYFLQKCVKNNQVVLVFRSILEESVILLDSPEFPASEVFCRVMCDLGKFALDESQELQIRTLAIDFCGLILTRLSSKMEFISENVLISSIAKYYCLALAKNPSLCFASRFFQREHGTTEQPMTPSRITDIEVADRHGCIQNFVNLLQFRPLMKLKNELIFEISILLDAKESQIRTRALRALSCAVQKDPQIMSGKISAACLDRVHDVAACVRDAALDCLGKCCLSDPTQHRLNMIMDRILDCAVSVRKRSIKILSSLFSIFCLKTQTEIVLKIFGRLKDEEETVVDAAKKTLRDLLFPLNATLAQTAILCMISKELVPDALVSLIKQFSKSQVETVFNRLKSSIQQSRECLKPLSILVQSHPSLLTIDFSVDLLCFKDPLILEILNAGFKNFDLIPKGFLNDLEIYCCNEIQKGEFWLLGTAVSLLCLTTSKSGSRERLLKLKSGCICSLRNIKQELLVRGLPNGTSEGHVRRYLSILGSLYRYTDLDNLDILLFFAQCELGDQVKATAIRAIGLSSLTHKRILIQNEVQSLFNLILLSLNPVLCESVLSIFLDFIKQEEIIDNEQQSFHDMQADGVAESIAQIYIEKITLLALNNVAAETSLDLMSIIATGGLAHPKFVMPAVISLQSCSDTRISAAARILHKRLHDQHHSVIYDNLKDSLIRCFEYSSLNFCVEYFFSIIESNKRDKRNFFSTLVRFFENQNSDLQNWTSIQLCFLQLHHEDDLNLVLNLLEQMMDKPKILRYTIQFLKKTYQIGPKKQLTRRKTIYQPTKKRKRTQ